MSKTPETDQNFVCDEEGDEWVHVSLARKLEMQRDELIEKLSPFAAFACGEPHVNEPECHNCAARSVIAKVKQESK
jgi:hypothetical protein